MNYTVPQAFSRCKVTVHIPSADRYLYLD